MILYVIMNLPAQHKNEQLHYRIHSSEITYNVNAIIYTYTTTYYHKITHHQCNYFVILLLSFPHQLRLLKMFV